MKIKELEERIKELEDELEKKQVENVLRTLIKSDYTKDGQDTIDFPIPITSTIGVERDTLETFFDALGPSFKFGLECIKKKSVKGSEYFQIDDDEENLYLSEKGMEKRKVRAQKRADLQIGKEIREKKQRPSPY